MVFGADWSREAFEEDEKLRKARVLPRVVPVTYTADDLRAAHVFMASQFSYERTTGVEAFAENMDEVAKKT